MADDSQDDGNATVHGIVVRIQQDGVERVERIPFQRLAHQRTEPLRSVMETAQHAMQANYDKVDLMQSRRGPPGTSDRLADRLLFFTYLSREASVVRLTMQH